MSLQGRQLGRYRILEPLGTGGMSVVYRGHDTTLGRDVAVKVLHAHLAEKQESRQRLVQEARAVARLKHPNILEVYDFSAESAAEAYLVTEYIRGCTLKVFVEQHPLFPPELAALVMHGIADALATAHEAGVIHRDLKPDNVMVREDGVLKLMDFGIAKLLDREERMTLTGALMGSPAHMAPEVIEGEPVGPAADVFSLGTMFYLFVTGKLPFLGPNPTATLKRILDGVYVDPAERCPAISRPLSDVLRRCLARRPEERFQDASALRDALGEVLGGAGIERPDETLTTFFASPEVAREVFTGQLVERLLESASADLEARRIHAAIDRINQAQLLAPEDPRGIALFDTLQAVQLGLRRRRGWLRAGAAALASTGVISAGLLLAGLGGATLDDAASDQAAGPQASEGSASAFFDPAAPGAFDGTAPGSTDRAALASAGDTQPASYDQLAPASAVGSAGDSPGDEAPDSREPSRGDPGERAEQATFTGAALVASAIAPAEPSRMGSAQTLPGPRAPASAEGRATKADATARPSAPARAAPGRIPVEILIRPWAHVAIDDEPFSREGVQTLRTSLSPGTHRVRLRCPFCVDSEEFITVSPTGPTSFALATELAPARLSFAISPPEAIVEVQGERRTAEAARQQPFLLRTPKGEIPSPREVRYTVHLAGYRPHDGTVQLNAGDEHTEHVTLTRQ